jgi:GT2 family glycosyltransferase
LTLLTTDAPSPDDHNPSPQQPRAARAVKSGLIPSQSPAASVVVIAFSKDRPLQLDAVLRSMQHHALDAKSPAIKVLWTASNWRDWELYRRLGRDHPGVELIEERSFKTQLVAATLGFDYIAFLVDDSIFFRSFSVTSAVAILESDPLLIGYSFRLGRNIDYCYSMNQAQTQPAWEPRPDGTLTYRWVGQEADFGYPIEVSSSLYRSADIQPLLERLPYRNPNSLEAALSAAAASLSARLPMLACPENSVAFGAPVNLVQKVFANRAGAEDAQSVQALSEAYRRGMRLDMDGLADFNTNSPHREIQLPLKELGPKLPLVSVVIPCFGQAEYLPAAIGSMFRQTVSDWEIVVVDDGSPDDTSAVFETLKAAHPDQSMALVRHANSGLAAARNAGFTESRGIYVLPLNADDQFAETMIEKTAALLDSGMSVAFAYTDAVHASEGSRQVIPAEDFDPDRECDINQPNYAALMPRSVWERAGGYNTNMKRGYEDWDLWLSCIDHSLLGRRVPEPLFLHQVRPDSMFSSAREHDRELRALLRRNHPRLYTPRRRTVRFIRRLTRLLGLGLRLGAWEPS